jgi:hypothetical protein
LPLALVEPSQIDWDALEIEPRWDEEGTRGVFSEKSMYAKLGLQKEDEIEKKARARVENRDGGSAENENIDDHDAMGYREYIPEERAGMYSMLNPVMRVGSLYPNMKVFRLAMRHYAIQREFELGIECTSTRRYRGFCRGENSQGEECPWRIHAVLEAEGSPTIIVCIFFLSSHIFHMSFVVLGD